MRPVVKTVGPLAAASANAVALSQTRGGAGNFTLNGALVTGGVATLDKPRRIIFTSAGNDAAVIFTIVGTNVTGVPQSETLFGANAGVAASQLDYATITSISSSGATAAAVTIGTNGVASTEWFRLNEWGPPMTSIQTDTVGTVNYTLQQSLDDPNDPTNPVAVGQMTWLNHPDPAAVGASAPIQTNYQYVPRWMRATLNSGTGAVTVTVAQSGGVGYA